LIRARGIPNSRRRFREIQTARNTRQTSAASDNGELLMS